MRALNMSLRSIRRLRRRRGHELRFCAFFSGVVRSGEIFKRPPQARFGVDQELTRGDDLLAWAQAVENLGAAAVFRADPDPRRSKMRAIVGDDHDAPRAG